MRVLAFCDATEKAYVAGVNDFQYVVLLELDQFDKGIGNYLSDVLAWERQQCGRYAESGSGGLLSFYQWRDWEAVGFSNADRAKQSESIPVWSVAGRLSDYWRFAGAIG